MPLNNTRFVAKELEELARLRIENAQLRQRVAALERSLTTTVVDMKRQLIKEQETAAPLPGVNRIRSKEIARPLGWQGRQRPVDGQPINVSQKVEDVFAAEGSAEGTERQV